jgi:hypothetical protein
VRSREHRAAVAPKEKVLHSSQAGGGPAKIRAMIQSATLWQTCLVHMAHLHPSNYSNLRLYWIEDGDVPSSLW